MADPDRLPEVPPPRAAAPAAGPAADAATGKRSTSRIPDETAAASRARAAWTAAFPFCHNGCPLGNLIPEWNDLVYRGRWRDGHRAAARHQQLPRVHRPAVPGAVRGVLRARHQRRSGDHQADRDEIIDGPGEGWVQPHAAGYPTGKRVAVVGRARRGWPRPSNWPAPATPSRSSSGPTASAACCATASPNSRWRSAVLDRRLEQMAAEGTRVPVRRSSKRRREVTRITAGATARRRWRTSTRWCWPAGRPLRVTCRCRDGSWTGSTWPWST